MRYTLENEQLTIFLEGEINSANAESVEEDIDVILNKGGFKNIKLNCNDLSYISSAGLRIILRMKQQYNDVAITEAQDGVYDILIMVGFNNLITIERK